MGIRAGWRWIGALCLSLGLLMALAGCAGASSSGQQATVDGLTIRLETPSAKVLDQATFVVHLSDAAGKPVDGADVYLDMTMKSMPMGSNKPIAQGEGGGVYRASSTFDMAGPWAITVHAEVAGKAHAATFTTDVADK